MPKVLCAACWNRSSTGKFASKDYTEWAQLVCSSAEKLPAVLRSSLLPDGVAALQEDHVVESCVAFLRSENEVESLKSMSIALAKEVGSLLDRPFKTDLSKFSTLAAISERPDEEAESIYQAKQWILEGLEAFSPDLQKPCACFPLGSSCVLR